MSRKLKRVPLDFDYPLKKLWIGYQNEHYVKCSACIGGWSPEYRYLENCIYGYSPNSKIALEPFVSEMENINFNIKKTSSNIYSALIEKGRELNLPDNWHRCKACDGNGMPSETQAAYNAWTPTDPPIGEGYQLWETTSEGSPISPVFSTLEELCDWCEGNATVFGSYKVSKGEWFQLLGNDKHEIIVHF